MMYFNRDISWLKFNELVLLQAQKKQLPLIERIKFLSIFSSNLDEFFRVRYPEILAINKLDEKMLQKMVLPPGAGVVPAVQTLLHEHLETYGKTLTKEILPALKKEGIYLYYHDVIRPEHHEAVREIFYTEILSFIQPIRLGSATEYHFIPENNKPYLIVTSRKEGDEICRFDVVNIPTHKLPRFYVLEPIDGMQYVIFIDDIIRFNLDRLFPSVEVEQVHSIKLNRNADVDIKEEYSADMLDRVEKKLQKRKTGTPSRFLYEKGMPLSLRLFLASQFDITPEEMFEGGRYHNLSQLNQLPTFGKLKQLPNEKPILYPKDVVRGDIFHVMSQQDFLLHLPYHSYAPVLSFFNQAAVDLHVTEIFITLYRVASESHIVNALISAARNGKKVTCYIELKARFDEENNIRWSRMMKEAGIKLIYSAPSIKVHSKIALVKRKVNKETQLFGLVSTGNFNESTAKFYTDHVLFTTSHSIVNELKHLFEVMKKPDQLKHLPQLKLEKLMVARCNMQDKLSKLIHDEMDKAEKGGKGLIRIKVNNLEDPWMIDLLYKASRKGVAVHLIVRSVCCLVPGVKGKSDNITIKRIVDKHLEHSRIFIFGTDAEAQVYIGSSDLMIRNLRHRIEVAVKIDDQLMKEQLSNYFNLQWSDNTNAVIIGQNLDNIPVKAGKRKINAQSAIFEYLSKQS